jgi:hypothetical protein
VSVDIPRIPVKDIYGLSEDGAALPWHRWKARGGCMVSDIARALTVEATGLPVSQWDEVPLGVLFADVVLARREIGRYAAQKGWVNLWNVEIKADRLPSQEEKRARYEGVHTAKGTKKPKHEPLVSFEEDQVDPFDNGAGSPEGDQGQQSFDL